MARPTTQEARPITPKARSNSGFTLIELLVVLFIIGVLVGTFVLSINIGPEPGEQLDEEAQRLLELSRLAQDQAVLTGEPIGLLLTAPDTEPAWQYNWQRYRGGQWVDAEAPLTVQTIPENIEVSLEVEGELVNFSRLESDDEETPPVPNIVFYPGGEVTPFHLTLLEAEAVDQQRVLSSERTGAVEKIDPDEEFL